MSNTTLIVCKTCGYDADNPDALRPGKQLYQHLSQALEQRQQQHGGQLHEITIKPFACLMACQRNCAVQYRNGTKTAYTLGDIQVTQEHIDAILDYATLYHASETGVVAYKHWPEAVKGKFIARFPPMNSINNDEDAST